MARHQGRPGPRDGGDLPQHAPWGRLGMGRRSSLSGEVRVAGVSFGDQLRDVRNDALTANFGPRISLAFLTGTSGAGFSLRGFVLARAKPHRLKPAPLSAMQCSRP